jgi:DNA-binding IclR family transcriptional regulator
MLRDLAERAALTAGQAHAYLVSFRTLGLVEQDPATGLYRLGPYALTLGLARLRWHDPLAVIWESVPAFAESLHLMVTMSIWTDAGPVILRLHEAPFQIYSNIRTGARYSLTQTATGRLFAALMPIDVVQPLVEAELTEARKAGVPDLVAAADYQAALTLIRAEGCSQTEGSPVPDISAIAAPVYDLNEQIVAAITLIGRRGRVACQPGGEHREAVLTFVKHLSQRLGYPAQT